MTNGKETPLYNGDSRRVFTRNKIWSISQAIIGPLVGAGVVWLINDRNRAWDALDAVTHDLEIHIVEGLRKHALLDKELERIDNDSAHRHSEQAQQLRQIVKDTDEVSDVWRECQLQQQRLWIEMAKLPPDEWEQRILQNERDILKLLSKEDK